jgi:hypothetical protein
VLLAQMSREGNMSIIAQDNFRHRDNFLFWYEPFCVAGGYHPPLQLSRTIVFRYDDHRKPPDNLTILPVFLGLAMTFVTYEFEELDWLARLRSQPPMIRPISSMLRAFRCPHNFCSKKKIHHKRLRAARKR